MESLKHTLSEMTVNFNAKMAEFERKLLNNETTTGENTTDFNLFRTFVTSSLKTLHAQVELLLKISDQQETRSRRKMLLFHGVAEEKKENTAELVAKVIADRLELPDVTAECFSRCHRLGHYTAERNRPIVVKFDRVPVRDRVWFSKTCLKNSGITISEFLTKARHDAFMLARKKFGVSNCWTQDGNIIVRTADGVRHRVSGADELDAIISDPPAEALNAASSAAPVSKGSGNTRPKRIGRK
ncbi:unnamed protein product [Colias eurytheme]|nr:unnamed protein product [Colias eurytheme]